MAIVQTITTTAAQGQDSISKVVYVSGDQKIVGSYEIKASGLVSGVNLDFSINGLKSITVTSDVGFQRMVAYGLSGSYTCDLASGMPYVWWSGYFSNPFAIASGNITGFSFQQLSGFTSGIVSVQLMKDGTP